MSGMDHRAVFAAARAPMLVLDLDRVIVDANRAYERVSGRRRAELMGMPLATVELAQRWRPVDEPILDELGRTVGILHQVEDVTREQILLRLVTASTQVMSVESKLVALAGAAVPALSDVCAVYQLRQPVPAGQQPRAPVTAWRLAAPTSDGTVGPVPGRSSVWAGGDPASAAIAAAATVVVDYTPDAPPAWAEAAGVAEAIRVGRVHCTALVPVIVDHLVHAFIAFGAGSSRPRYDEDDREMFELIAAQTALAMRQGGRYERYRDTAITLQRALLTDPPAVPGLDIVVRYRPAGAGSEVGGDWHDVFPLTGTDPAGHVDDLAVVVGDVSGHDMSAAAVMGQLRSMVRGFTVHNGGSPDATLTALDHVIRRTRLTFLATCIVMHVRAAGDPAEGLELTWSNAGHCSPVLLDADGATTVLHGPRDPALGAFTDAPRTSATHHLPHGSTLLLFSDGLFERRRLDYDESFDQLITTITAVAGLDTGKLCDELLAAASHDDDVVLVALRRH